MKSNNIYKTVLTGMLLLGVLTVNAQQKSVSKSISIDPADTSWYPSVYGTNDEIGAANLITPEFVLQSLKLVKKGKNPAFGS